MNLKKLIKESRLKKPKKILKKPKQAVLKIKEYEPTEEKSVYFKKEWKNAKSNLLKL